MKSRFLAILGAIAILVASTSLITTSNETSIRKDKYEVPPNG